MLFASTWRSATHSASHSGLARAALLCVLVAGAGAGCRRGDGGGATGAGPVLTATGSRRCVVHLHGKGQRGGPPEVRDGVLHLRPEGNAAGWGGRQWLYFPESRYAEVRAIVAGALAQAGCAQAILDGFSNGAAAAASLYCHGERFGGVVIGALLDDPVPDHGADGCAPAPGERLSLYWSGALGDAVAGRPCAPHDWTCAGGETVGVEEYARRLGTATRASTQTTHAETRDPPELRTWWSE